MPSNDTRGIIKQLSGPICMCTLIVSLGPQISTNYFVYMIMSFVLFIVVAEKVRSLRDANRKKNNSDAIDAYIASLLRGKNRHSKTRHSKTRFGRMSFTKQLSTCNSFNEHLPSSSQSSSQSSTSSLKETTLQGTETLPRRKSMATLSRKPSLRRLKSRFSKSFC